MNQATAVFLLLCPVTLWAQARPEAQTQALRVQPANSSARRVEVLELAPSTINQQERLQRLVGPRTKKKISQIAPAFSVRARQLPPTADFHGLAVSEVRSGFQGAGTLSNGDVEALAFMVMMQATKDAQSDLKNIMDGVQQTNQQKQAQRSAQNQKNSMSELGDEQSLRLQMEMDRLSKLMEALSNIEKKMAQTDDSIVKNLK
jgi:hypothetical protein